MNKVITINLNGNAYQLEEAGFEALRTYLDHAARSLAGNPDKDEIVADIELAIADKCRALLNALKTVVTAREIEQIIAEMGPVDTGSSDSASAGATSSTSSSSTSSGPASQPGAASPPPPVPEPVGVKRLYRIREGRMLTGVCNGIGAYLGLDPTVIRVIFVLLAFITAGGMILAYGILTIALPVAETTAEKAAAHGVSHNTAQDFVRRAKAGYYDAARNWGDRASRREWKRNLRRDMREWRHNFRREWRSGSCGWGWDWRWQAPSAPCTPGAPLGAGWWIALPFVALFRAALLLFLILGLISLFSKGTLLGLALPAGLPVWAAAVLLIVFYNLMVWPVRFFRHAVYLSSNGASHAVYGCFDAIVGLSVAVLLLWYFTHHSPDLREALHNLPATLHHAADQIRDWWNQK